MIRRLRQAFQSTAMAPIVVGEEYYPGPNVQKDEQILELIKNNLMTLWHPAETLKMGTRQTLWQLLIAKPAFEGSLVSGPSTPFPSYRGGIRNPLFVVKILNLLQCRCSICCTSIPMFC